MKESVFLFLDNVQSNDFLEGHDKGPLRLTVSIGLAFYSAAYRSPEQLLERADQALYKAKQNGRNSVISA